MALPSNFGTIRVIADFSNLLGVPPKSGKITWAAPANTLLRADRPDAPNDLGIVTKPIVKTITEEDAGHVEMDVPINDDPDISPVTTYSLTIDIDGYKNTFQVQLLRAMLPGPVDLLDLITVGQPPPVSGPSAALTRYVADLLYEPLGGGGGGGEFTGTVDYETQVTDKPLAFPTTAASITDGGVAGRELVRQATVEAVRTMLGVPTLGTTSASQALPGNWRPTTTDVTNFTDVVNLMISQQVSAIVGNAPALLDTLGELSDAIGDDANFRTTILNAIAARVATTTYDAHVASTAAHGATSSPTASTIMRRDVGGGTDVTLLRITGTPSEPTHAARMQDLEGLGAGSGDAMISNLNYDVVQNADGTWPTPPAGYRRYWWIYTTSTGQNPPIGVDEIALRVR